MEKVNKLWDIEFLLRRWACLMRTGTGNYMSNPALSNQLELHPAGLALLSILLIASHF
jgi:hypothetical protein